MGAPFSQADFVVFKSIAEQSAFALYNAIIYSMANEKNGWITTSKSRETFSASCSHLKRRPSMGSKSAGLMCQLAR